MNTQPFPPAPEDTSANDPAELPSTDPLAPENTPVPPPDWTAEPEDPQAPGQQIQNPGIQYRESQDPESQDPESQDPAIQDRESIEPAAIPILTPIPAAEAPPIISWGQPVPPAPREERIPHIGHTILLALLVIVGLLVTFALLSLAFHAHLWGISNTSQAQTDYRYALASQGVQYLITFAGCLLLFPIVWRRPFFEGIHWRGDFALHYVGRLISAAVVCFFVAMINGMLMPGPTNAPIDQLFRAPGAAWAMFGFGVTLAPFFEEMAFRGFLLPSLCTAWDWSVEQFAGTPRRPLAEDGSPNWSLTAMVIASVVTSIPFALMHGFQTAWSLGPFLLLVFVSLVLCWVRLSTRSLAASTVVHACYNFMLFSFMLLGTGGFKHLDKM